MITTNIVKWGLSTLILATEFNIIGESFITYEATIGFILALCIVVVSYVNLPR